MIVVDFSGYTVTNELRRLIEEYYVGNILLSHKNIEGTLDTSFLGVASLGVF